MHTPIRVRALAFAAALVLSVGLAEALAWFGLPPASAQALVLALAVPSR